MRFAVIRSLFNDRITQALLDGAKSAFAESNVGPDQIDVYDVPGAFELPLAAQWAVQTQRYNAVVCLGCIIRGDTPHFDFVAGAAAQGIADVALRTNVPVVFGVITANTAAQAQERAVPGGRTATHAPDATGSNKGYEAARSALAMAGLRRSFDQ